MRLFWTACCILILSWCADAAVSWPIKASANNHFLAQSNDSPFLVKGEAPWNGFASLTTNQWKSYLDAKSTQNVNAVVVRMLDRYYQDLSTNAGTITPPANYYGEEPLTVADDFSTPNQDYFDRCKMFFSLAQERGIVVLAAPMYLANNPSYTNGYYYAVVNSSSNAMDYYGRFLGTNFVSVPNVIWVFGGDHTPGDARTNIDICAKALASVDTNHLITAHTDEGASSKERYTTETWLTLNSLYDYDSISTHMQAEYASPALPVVLLETKYEHEGFSDWELRKQLYWTHLNGGCGYFLGHEWIWQFKTGYETTFVTVATLDATRCRDLLDDLPWHQLIPDSAHAVATNGYGSGWNYHATAYDSNRHFVISYFSTNGTLAFKMTNVVEDYARADWFDPRTGTITNQGVYETTGARSFTTPDTNDWVLLLVGQTNWYVDKAASGLNNGSSWTDAWESFADIDWTQISPGHTIYISGGASGQTYTEALTTAAEGTSASPITISVGRDTGHTGTVSISNKLTLAGDWITVDGSKGAGITFDTAFPTAGSFTTNNLLTLLSTNIGLVISYRTNHGVLCQGLYGNKVKWVKAHNCGEAYTNTATKLHGFVHYFNAPAGSIVTNCAFQYCWAVSNSYDGFNFTANNGTTWGSMEISYCISHDNGDDNMQLSDCSTVHHCWIAGKRFDLAVGHPDAFQAVGWYLDFHNNYLSGFKNSWIYHEYGYNDTNKFGNWRVYNNLFYWTGSWSNNGYGVYFGTQMDNTTNRTEFTMPAKDGGTNTAHFENSWVKVGQHILAYSTSGPDANSTNYCVMEVVDFSGTTNVILKNLETTGGDYASNIEPGESVPTLYISGENTNEVSWGFILDNVDIANVHILGNTFVNGAQNGVQFYTSTNHMRNVGMTNVLIKNNLFHDASTLANNQAFALNDSKFTLTYGTNQVIVTHNIASGQSRQVRYGKTNYSNINLLSTWAGFSGNTSNNPVFVDESNFEFALDSSDTTAKNAGTDLSSLGFDDVDVDLTGAARGGDGNWDIGAFEDVGGSNSVWYVDNTATGANDGTTWANAWESLADIAWTNILPGHVLNISGGVSGKTYAEYLYVGASGTDANPIVIRPGQSSPHNGLVTINYLRSTTNNYFTINGAKAGAVEPTSTLDVPAITNYIGIKVSGTEYRGFWATNAATNIVLKWIEFANNGDDANEHAVFFAENPVRGCEVSCCYIFSPSEDGINVNRTDSTTLGAAINIHHNYLVNVAEDAIQSAPGCDIHHNYILPGSHVSGRGVMDAIRTGTDGGVRIYGNFITGWSNAVVVNLAEENDGGACYIYDNLILDTNHIGQSGIKILFDSANYGFGKPAEWVNILTNQIVNDGLRIYNNTLVGMPWAGVDFFRAYSTNDAAPTNWLCTLKVYLTNCTVKNNLIYDCGQSNSYTFASPFRMEGWDSVISQGIQIDHATTDIDNNNLSGNNTTWLFNGTNFATAALFNTGADHKTNSSTLPTFSTAFYQPQTNDLAAVDQGQDLTAVAADKPTLATDIIGAARPDSEWDIGAFEIAYEFNAVAATNLNAVQLRGTQTWRGNVRFQ